MSDFGIICIIRIQWIILTVCSHLIIYSDDSHPQEHKQRIFQDIENKLQQQPGVGDPSGFVGNAASSSGGEPSLEYELMRRRVRSNTQEMWNYVNNEMTKVWQNVKKAAPEMGPKMDEVMGVMSEHKRALINDMTTLQTLDGYERWRHKESQALSDLVQRRLSYLQHPDDCGTARKLVCRLNKVIRHISIGKCVGY